MRSYSLSIGSIASLFSFRRSGLRRSLGSRARPTLDSRHTRQVRSAYDAAKGSRTFRRHFWSENIEFKFEFNLLHYLGFTSLCESYANKSKQMKDFPTDQLTKHLNTYLGRIVQGILLGGGDVLKFAGKKLILITFILILIIMFR